MQIGDRVRVKDGVFMQDGRCGVIREMPMTMVPGLRPRAYGVLMDGYSEGAGLTGFDHDEIEPACGSARPEEDK